MSNLEEDRLEEISFQLRDLIEEATTLAEKYDTQVKVKVTDHEDLIYNPENLWQSSAGDCGHFNGGEQKGWIVY